MRKCSRRTEGTVLEKLVSDAVDYMKSLGYNFLTWRYHRGVWRAFVKHAQSHGKIKRFSPDLVTKFLESLPKTRDRHILASMRIITEFAQHGCFSRRRCVAQYLPLPAKWTNLLTDYEQFYQRYHRNACRSLRIRRRDIHRFLHYLVTNGIKSPQRITAVQLSGFVGLLTHLRPKTVATTVSTIRSFLRYLCLQGLIKSTLIEQLPKIRIYPDGPLPTIWTEKDTQSLLNVVDRASPMGKRDYAILLLAARLGLRAGDIRTLRLEQVDWDRGKICIVQAKTRVPLELPLLEDVGQSLIDYLQNGRPITTHREIFLRHLAPFGPFGRDNNLHAIITTYRRRAGIKLPKQCRQGLHSLRHTLASRLLEARVPVDVIAGVLGHISPETTRLYMRVDTAALRRVAIDPEEVLHG